MLDLLSYRQSLMGLKLCRWHRHVFACFKNIWIRAWKNHLKIETENIWSISAYPLLFADTIQHRLRVLCTHTFFIFYIFVKNIFYLILPDVYNFTRMRRVRGLIYGILWTPIFGTKTHSLKAGSWVFKINKKWCCKYKLHNLYLCCCLKKYLKI